MEQIGLIIFQLRDNGKVASDSAQTHFFFPHQVWLCSKPTMPQQYKPPKRERGKKEHFCTVLYVRSHLNKCQQLPLIRKMLIRLNYKRKQILSCSATYDCSAVPACLEFLVFNCRGLEIYESLSMEYEHTYISYSVLKNALSQTLHYCVFCWEMSRLLWWVFTGIGNLSHLHYTVRGWWYKSLRRIS